MAAKSHRTHATPLSASVVSIVLAAAMCIGVLPGCYQRVTRATGFGADQYNVSEPYQRNSAVDDWLFGKQESGTRSGSKIPPSPQRE